MAQLTTGHWVSQMIGIAAQLNIADLLRDGPRPPAELARSTATNADALYRLMRALASLGIFFENTDGTFQHTPLSACLQTDVPGSMRSWARAVTQEHFWNTWPELMYSVQTGGPAYDHKHGEGVFDYFNRNPAAGKVFDEAMTGFSSMEIAPVVAAYDFSGIQKLVDVAGGHGSLLCTVLKANPHIRGVVCDMPHVVAGARKTIEAEGLADRCEATVADMFASLPAGGDAYMMKHIIHDWDDDRCVRILENCRSAMVPGGKVLILDAVIQPGNHADFSKLLDIAMLSISGKERTEQQFRDLLSRAGFRLARIVPTASPVSVIEGVPV
jgi:O-methyltransferase/methyltransferase family protein